MEQMELFLAAGDQFYVPIGNREGYRRRPKKSTKMLVVQTNSPPLIISTNGAPLALHFRAPTSATLNQDCSAIFLLCFSFPFVIWLQSGVSWIVGRLLFSSLGKKTGTTLSLPGTISHFYLLGYQCLYFWKHLEIVNMWKTGLHGKNENFKAWMIINLNYDNDDDKGSTIGQW